MNQKALLTVPALGALALLAGYLPSALAKTDAPKDLISSLKRDNTPIADAGSLKMSYADVAETILPSVVTIFPSTPMNAQGDMEIPDMEDLPPQLRPFFRRFFDQQENNDEEGSPAPRRRMPHGEMPRMRGVGSGVIVTEDGYILTNNHVVQDSDDIEVAVESNGTKRSYKATVIGTDPETDVAMIKIDAKGLVPATIGDSSSLRVGDVVLAAGAPMEMNLSITQGIVSALGRSNLHVTNYADFIQTDAAINPGNSGGPLVDAKGRVVGINTAILSRSGMNGGIGFAIPVNMALSVMEDLLDDGVIQRGFLGVQIQDLDLEKSELFGLKSQGGALVSMVGGESPAEKAGVEVGDIIVKADGKPVDDSSRLRLIVSSIKPGQVIPLELLRDGKPLTVQATLGELPADALAAARSVLPGAGARAPQSEILPGVTARPVDAAARKEHDLPKSVAGLVVTEVKEDSRAAAMGLEVGDVIQEINQKPVEDLKRAHELLKSGNQTALVRIYRGGDTMLMMINTED